MQQIFYGKVEHGQLRLISQDQYEKLIKALEGQSIKLVLGKRPKIRTSKQNRYYFGVVVKMICDEVGEYGKEGTDRMHAHLKSMFAPREEHKYIGIDGKEVVKMEPIHTADLLTTQFSNDYVEKVKIWAATYLNIYIPDPNECEQDRV